LHSTYIIPELGTSYTPREFLRGKVERVAKAPPSLPLTLKIYYYYHYYHYYYHYYSRREVGVGTGKAPSSQPACRVGKKMLISLPYPTRM
jgi:hypothetical protein